MSEDAEGGDDDASAIEDEIYALPIEPELLRSPKRGFMPWHKPRKHYLRIHQWCSLIRALMGDLGLKNGDVLRYLGLPGDDLLDVRTLHGVCHRAKVKLRYLGFDTGAKTDAYEVNLSGHEVAALGFIDPFSRVLRDRVQQIARPESIARMYFDKVGPFDVINLDICDSIALSSGDGSYFDALRSACELQLSAGRARPWLLFLATRATRDQVDGVSKEKLFRCIQRNMDESPVFAQCVRDRLGLSLETLVDEIANVEKLEHAQLVSAFGLGLAKWLLTVAMSASPRVLVTLLSAYSYRVEVGEPDMLSLAFRFEPVIEPRIDPVALSGSSSSAANVLSESQLAVKIAESIAALEDVDRKLTDDPILMRKITEQAADILVTARYDRTAYLAWVAETPLYGRSDHPDGGTLKPSG